jgi:hypothetical protein
MTIALDGQSEAKSALNIAALVFFKNGGFVFNIRIT